MTKSIRWLLSVAVLGVLMLFVGLINSKRTAEAERAARNPPVVRLTPSLAIANVSKPDKEEFRRQFPNPPQAAGDVKVSFFAPGTSARAAPNGYFNHALSPDRNVVVVESLYGLLGDRLFHRRTWESKTRFKAQELQRGLATGQSLLLHEGLLCNPGIDERLKRRFCVAQMPGGEWADVDIAEPRPHVFSTVRVSYFSERYDGVSLLWSAHIDHLPRWREVDNEMWRVLAERNVSR